MHVRLAPRSVIAAVAAAVVLAVLAAPSAAAEEPPAVATVLQPGWNMAAWLGPDAPVQAIFDAVPELELVSAWDAEAQRERRARPRSVLRGGLTRLTTGMGLWLMVGGDAPAEWTREAPPDGVLLELRAGRNIVGWTGRDGIPAAEALARFGEALVAAWHWNAEAGGFERYRPGAPDGTNTLRALRRGDAIAVELASGARWWQSGVWRTTFEFIGNVPEGRQAEIRAETADVLAFFAERYGIVPPEFTVRVHPGLDIAADAAARLIRIGRYAVDGPLIGGTIAHEYTHVLQHSTEGGSSPAWLIEGQATYAGGLFFQSRGDRTGDRQRAMWWLHALDVIPSLHDLADSGLFYAEGWPAYALGALATEWLAVHAEAREAEQSGGAPPTSDSGGITEHESHIRYWQAVPSPERWSEAFETAFGITVDDFYDEFGAYRADILASSAPHRFDDRNGPALVFVGDVPDAVRADIKAELDRMHRLYTERFATIPAEFSIFVGADLESVAQHLPVFDLEPGAGSCSHFIQSAILVVTTACSHFPYEQYYFTRVLDTLAPWGSLPEVPEGRDRRGPYWLRLATERYIEYAYRAGAGADTLERIRSGDISWATRRAAPLSGQETRTGVEAAGYGKSRALGFLAAERLVALAGEPAIFEYYRLLPAAADWRAAFAAAFGVAPADFYADFEAYRADSLALSAPHRFDDRNGSALVFVGDVPDAMRADVKAELDRVHRLYTERFATIPAEFSIFVGTDARQYLPIFGHEPNAGFCSVYIGDVMFIETTDCQPFDYFKRHYFTSVLDILAPWGSLPDVPEGRDRRGPYWLRLAAERYTEHAYRAIAGADTLERIRSDEISRAMRTAAPLSGLETYADAEAAGYWESRALGFLAAERLVALAGEPALFEYYRLLPAVADWRAAFAAAFGVAPADFYADFEAYRARIAPTPG